MYYKRKTKLFLQFVSCSEVLVLVFIVCFCVCGVQQTLKTKNKSLSYNINITFPNWRKEHAHVGVVREIFAGI